LCDRDAREKIRGNENKDIGRVQDSKAGMLTERLYDWLDL